MIDLDDGNLILKGIASSKLSTGAPYGFYPHMWE